MSTPGSAERWAQVDRLLDLALALPPAEREASVQRHTADDPSLRDEVMALLGALQTRGDLLDGTAIEAISPASHAVELQAGQRIGAYRIIDLLGRGGMGEVYRAERADGQFENQVALKLLRQDAVEHLGLFVSERHILARLVHPGIARLYDAGVSEDGRPYMVMELIDGSPVVQWCKQHRLGLDARLALFEQICDAVSYAHQNLVIHRDIKPGNVLVNAEGRIKLLDFGVAKLLSNSVEEATRSTPLTLSYAAPEQLTGGNVSTTADLYALGVLLFELVTERLPWSNHQAAMATLVDKVLNEVAPAPSAVATASTAVPFAPRQLAGDIDAIVAKALRKDPASRYASVSGLSAEIRRHLRGEPIAAREGARLYVFRRFVRRYRWAVAGVAALIVSLAAGLAGTIWQAQRAETQARTADAVQAFLVDLFRANSSSQDDPVKARETTARQLLDIGASRIDASMRDAPAAKMSVLQLFGELYDDLALDDEAVRIRKQELALARNLYGNDSTETATALIGLAGSMHSSSDVNDRAKVLAEATGILDRQHDFTSETRGVLLGKLSEHYQSEDVPRALGYARQEVKLFEAKPPSGLLAEAFYAQGLIEQGTGLTREARTSFARAVEVSIKADGFPNPALPRFYAYLGETDYGLQDIASAEKNARLALRTAREINGEDHVDTLQTEMRLGRFLFDTGRTPEGLALMESARQRAIRLRGLDDPFHTPQTFNELGHAQARAGLPAEGLKNMQVAIANRRANRPGTVFLAAMLENSAGALLDLGRLDEAGKNLDEATAIRLKSGLEPGSEAFNLNTGTRVRLALAQGKTEAARALVKQMFVDTDQARGLSLTAMDKALLAGQVDLAAKDYPAAIASARQTETQLASSGLQDYLRSYRERAASIHGEALLESNHAAEACPLLEQALQESLATQVAQSPGTATAYTQLARCEVAVGKIELAHAHAAAAKSIFDRNQSTGVRPDASSEQLALALRQAGH